MSYVSKVMPRNDYSLASMTMCLLKEYLADFTCKQCMHYFPVLELGTNHGMRAQCNTTQSFRVWRSKFLGACIWQYRLHVLMLILFYLCPQAVNPDPCNLFKVSCKVPHGCRDVCQGLSALRLMFEIKAIVKRLLISFIAKLATNLLKLCMLKP